MKYVCFRFTCGHCGEGFRSASGLSRHCNVANLPLTHSCDNCPLKFPNAILLETHKERCNAPPDARLICHICGKQLANTSNLKNHLVRHMGTRSHKCSECDAAFALPSELNVHKKSHSSERPYACRYDCGKSFRYCSARSIHERYLFSIICIYFCQANSILTSIGFILTKASDPTDANFVQRRL